MLSQVDIWFQLVKIWLTLLDSVGAGPLNFPVLTARSGWLRSDASRRSLSRFPPALACGRGRSPLPPDNFGRVEPSLGPKAAPPRRPKDVAAVQRFVYIFQRVIAAGARRLTTPRPTAWARGV